MQGEKGRDLGWQTRGDIFGERMNKVQDWFHNKDDEEDSLLAQLVLE